MSQLEKLNLDRVPLSSRDPLVLSDDDELPVIQVPGVINQYLRDYQRDGIRFLYGHYKNGRGAILADDMGLGKTVQVIALLAAVLRKTGSVKDLEKFRPDFIRKMENSLNGIPHSSEDSHTLPFLVIGPASVMYNWLDEFETWGYFRIGKYHKQYKKQTVLDLRHSKLDVVLTTYETCRDNIDELSSIEWNAVFADEVHKIKGAGSEMTLALKKLPCQRRFGLTGTPLQNRLDELWCIMDWANSCCFSDFKSFYKKYVLVIERGQKLDVTKRHRAEARKAQQDLAKAYSKFLLRRTKDLIADQMPRKDELVVYCRPTDLQTDIYQAILDEADMKYVLTQKHKCSCGSGKTNVRCHFKHSPSGVPVRSLTMTFMHLLLKAANHVALLMPGVSASGKQQQYADDICQKVFAKHVHLAELGHTAAFRTLSDPKYCGKMKVLQGLLTVFKKQKSKVLLFSYSTKLLDVLETYIMSMGYEYRRLDGSTPSAMRFSLVQDFNKEPNIFIFLISTKSGGIGLNLTGANVVIIYDPNWNPAHDLQAQDRAYRLGQRRDVRVFRLICSGTIEENIYLRQVFKQQIGSVALEKKSAKRLFYGKSLSSDRQKSDELFGVENLFQLRTGDSCLTNDILLRNDKIEAELRGFQFAEYVSAPHKERLDESADNNSGDVTSEVMSFDGYTSSESVSDVDDPVSTDDSPGSTGETHSIPSSSASEDEEGEDEKGTDDGVDKNQHSIQSVSDVLGRSDVVHVHKNKNLVCGNRVEDHITNCALIDVYELHKNSQLPAVQCQPLSSSSSSSCESDENLVKTKRCIRHRQPKVGASGKKSSKEDTNSCRVVGKSNVLLGRTPVAIRRQQFQQLASSLGLTNSRELAEWVLHSCAEERQQMLRVFYVANHPHLESVFDELKEEELLKKGRTRKVTTAQNTPQKKRQNLVDKQCRSQFASNEAECKRTKTQKTVDQKRNHFTSLKHPMEVTNQTGQEVETVASKRVLNQGPCSSKERIKNPCNVLEKFFSDSEAVLGRKSIMSKQSLSKVNKGPTSCASADISNDDSSSTAVIDEFLTIRTSANTSCNKRKTQLHNRNAAKVSKTLHSPEIDRFNDVPLDEIFF